MVEGSRSLSEVLGIVVRLESRVAELEERNAGLEARVLELEAENTRLGSENAELRRRVGADSSNSSKPPSSDGLSKAPPVSLRGGSGRKRGGQPGRDPKYLAQVEHPDEIVVHRPDRCGSCDAVLPRAAPEASAPVVRQVFDLPEIRAHVTEHRMLSVACPCGHATRAIAPADATGPTCLGSGITAVAAYLHAGQLLPVARVADTIRALTGISVSAGWVSAAACRAQAAVADANSAIRAGITAAGVAHFDESVTRVAGRAHWFHAASTPQLTAYHADEHGRGLGAMTGFGILPAFTGIAVHDAYAAYDSVALAPHGKDTVTFTHALCIAHVQRELRGIAEHDPEATADGWAASLDLHIADMLRWRDHWAGLGNDRLPEFKRAKALARWDHLTEQGLAAHPYQPGRTAGQSHARRLAVRLNTRRDDYLSWLDDFTIPATNNEAERSVRMIKSKTKVSGGFRTLTGLQTFLAIRGYLDTLRKNNHDLITGLQAALNRNAWAPG